MILEYGYKTDIGHSRMINEDACAIASASSLVQYAIVCDGMGGHQAGEVASEIATKIVSKNMENSSKLKMEKLREAIESANDKIFSYAVHKEAYKGMGTTLVMAVFESELAIIANVGDSRAYHYYKNDNSIKQISKDHSLLEELIRSNQISQKEIQNFPYRNVITRAVGSMQKVKTDIFEVEWSVGDSILLCSDGLTRYVNDDELTLALADYNKSAQMICDELVDIANERGGNDNITIIITRLLSQSGGVQR